MNNIHYSSRKRLSKSTPKLIINNKNTFQNYSNKIKMNQIFFSQKSFLEVILGLIKKCHLDFFSSLFSIKNLNNNNFSKNEIRIKAIKSLKKILLILKNNLNLLQKENLQKLNNIKKEIKNRKEIIELNSKEINKIKKGIKIYKNKNFQTENEIKMINNLINSKNDYIFLVKSYECFLEIFSEYECKDNKDFEDIEKLYKLKIINLKNKLIMTKNDINKKEKEIENINKKIKEINNLKKIKDKKYINNKDVIIEDTKEYLDTIVKYNNNKINNNELENKNINKNIFIKNNNKINIIENNNINITYNNKNNKNNENKDFFINSNIKKSKTIFLNKRLIQNNKKSFNSVISLPHLKILKNNKKITNKRSESSKYIFKKIFI